MTFNLPESLLNPPRMPENVHFWLDDIRSRQWWHPQQPDLVYDYIHTRMLLGSFRDFREIIQKGYNNLAPGGYMESQEVYTKVFCSDKSMPADFKLLEWTREQDKAAMLAQRPLRIANKLKTWYEQAGFVDVREDVFHVPLNPWSKDSRHNMLGKHFQENMLKGLHGWSVLLFCENLGWTEVQLEVYLAHVRNAVTDQSVHAYYKLYVYLDFDYYTRYFVPHVHHANTS